MTLNSEANEYFKSTPVDIDPDQDIDDMIERFEGEHLTERERKLIEKSLNN